ncbi:MAG: hypothetical protein LBU84_16560 [Prevotella sp.]|jgi:hypothetical protein|nr:hypothetical protein [Prevotella sp.]
MSANKIKYTAGILLLLYIGYFGCVSYYVHSHIYNGVIYVHSHPYKKLAKEADDNKQPPFETHHHTSAGFFTFNQLSNTASFEAVENSFEAMIMPQLKITYKQLILKDIIPPAICYFNHRAPPAFSVL